MRVLPAGDACIRANKKTTCGRGVLKSLVFCIGNIAESKSAMNRRLEIAVLKLFLFQFVLPSSRDLIGQLEFRACRIILHVVVEVCGGRQRLTANRRLTPSEYGTGRHRCQHRQQNSLSSCGCLHESLPSTVCTIGIAFRRLPKQFTARSAVVIQFRYRPSVGAGIGKTVSIGKSFPTGTL
mgnify:CR=1 FL=1